MAIPSNILNSYKILIVDSDVELSGVLKTMLSEMGFTNVNSSRSGKDAIKLLGTKPFDFLITEWDTQDINGLELLKHIRKSKDSPNRAIPVIMLTGRAEVADVITARDYGINEYVVKPFSAKTIYNRISRIIESPRSFVMAKNFVGPDRRAHIKPKDDSEDKREKSVKPKILPANLPVAISEDLETPKIWLPDFSLKLRLGKNIKLGDLITPSVLSNAQLAIDSITDTSILWIKENLNQLKALNERLIQNNYPANVIEEISGLALLINSRAGTFGYNRASEIAYALYLFTRKNFDPKIKAHQMVLQKHIEVLHIILGNQMSGDAGDIGAKVATELKSLIQKYS